MRCNFAVCSKCEVVDATEGEFEDENALIVAEVGVESIKSDPVARKSRLEGDSVLPLDDKRDDEFSFSLDDALLLKSSIVLVVVASLFTFSSS
jgi:hypothetical protein